MSIQNLFNQQRKPVIRGQNLILDNKNKCSQRFSKFDNEVFELGQNDKGFSYEDIRQNLSFDPRCVLEKQFKNNYIKFIKLMAISMCDKINLSTIYDAQSAVLAITDAMNDGGVETGMLQLVPWLLECAKLVTRNYVKRNCDLLEVIEKCDDINNSFGEALSYCVVHQCIAAVLIRNPSLKNELMKQISLIKTACTYHIAGKMEMGAKMSYHEALNLLVQCIMQNPESFRFYATFIKNFQNTSLHVVYKVGAELAVEGIKIIRKMQQSGRCKKFEQQLAAIGGVSDFGTQFDDIISKNSLLNVGATANDRLDRLDQNFSANISDIMMGFNRKFM